MKKLVVNSIKVLSIIVILIFSNVFLTLVLERTGVVHPTPLNIPKYYENEIRNFYAAFIGYLILASWAYAFVVVTYHYLQKLSLFRKNFTKSFLAIALCLAAFLLYWAGPESGRKDLLAEGLIVYSFLGVALVFLHKLFFSKTKAYSL
jgi:hypothetical protein